MAQEKFFVYYADMSIPDDKYHIVEVMATWADEATDLADAQVDLDTFTWVHTESQQERDMQYDEQDSSDREYFPHTLWDEQHLQLP